MRCAISCATTRSRRWPTQDAVLVHRRDRLSQAGQGLLRRGAAVHGLGRQDHQLPDRRVRGLRVPARPCLHRPGALSAQGLDRRSGPPGGGACAARDRLCDQAPSRAGDDRAGDRGRACRSPGWRPTASTAWARSRWRCGGPARATCSASTATHPFNSWGDKPPVAGTAEEIAQALPASAWARLSAGDGNQGPAAARLGLSGTGRSRGRRVRRQPLRPVDAGPADPPQHRRRRACLLHPPGARPGPGSRCWSRSKGTAGRSRTASRPPRTSSASTTTRPAPGTAGTGTSRSSCWPSPCWPPSATRRTRPHPQKSRSGSPGGTRPHPLVGPGNPPHRHPPRAATHPARPRHRLVALATRPPSRRTTLTSETKNATVMLP